MKVPSFYYDLLRLLEDHHITSINYHQDYDVLSFEYDSSSSDNQVIDERYSFRLDKLKNNAIKCLKDSIDYISNINESN